MLMLRMRGIAGDRIHRGVVFNRGRVRRERRHQQRQREETMQQESKRGHDQANDNRTSFECNRREPGTLKKLCQNPHPFPPPLAKDEMGGGGIIRFYVSRCFRNLIPLRMELNGI